MSPCIYIPIIVGLICAILGYLLGRLFRSSNDNSSNDNDSIILELRNKISQLEANLDACNKAKLALQNDLDACRESKSGLSSDLKLAREASANLGAAASLAKNSNDDSELKDKITKLEAELDACNKAKANLQTDLEAAKNTNNNLNLIPFNADAAKAVFGKKIKQDDLKIVEGIGPKIEGLFHNFDIKTWKALSEASIEKCQEVLNSGGERYRIHKPDTWPQQAKLAYEGKWEELLKWQDELDGGKL
ncbi:hypothetical protein [Tenacibaculum jejuense]|uniref:LSU ribosomal protein L21p n=1 Tax=Tenacibaculum jejuense TaxID=584609 RepID=A0A238UEX4_9FLAO|nr:hypothetical protein [Tenacibaculum jejuense]SNR17711.1 conserved protein of unknown function [Tenacibaculum jejuense]